jgi:uncharacterized protein YjiS (DUF1127 family)
MSQSSILEPRRVSSGTGAGRSLVSKWIRTMAIWLIRQHGRQELSSLDDRLLEDIGISREDALWKAGKPFWRP